MPEDIEKIVIGVEVDKEKASNELKELQKEIDKLSTSEEKLAKIKSYQAKYSGKNKNATQETKAFNKEIQNGLKLLKQEQIQSSKLNKTKIQTPKYKLPKEFSFKNNLLKDTSKKLEKENTLPQGVIEGQQQAQEEIKSTGKLIQKVTDQEETSLKEVYERYDKAGNKIKQYWKVNKEGNLDFEKEVTSYQNKKYKSPTLPILEEAQGEVLKYDSVKQTLRTKEIIDDNNEIIKSYKDVIEVNGKLQGVLTSSITQKRKQEKLPKSNKLEQAQGKVLKYDSVKNTLQTEEIIDNNKKIIRSYENVRKTTKGFKGVLTSSVEKPIKTVNSLANAFKTLKDKTKGLGRIKRIFQSIIAFRLASSVITLFVNSFKKGIEALKQSGGELSKPFTKLNQSTTAISVSLATIIIPLVQQLANVLDPLSQKLIDVANSMSYSNAVAKGQTEYYKLSKEKIDEYVKSLENANKQLTQLDKFATLSGQKSIQLGEMVSIDQNTEEGKKNIEEAEKIKTNVKDIIELVTSLTNAFKKLIGFVEKLGNSENKTFRLLIFSLLALVSPFGRVIALLESFKTLTSDASIGAKLLAGTLITLVTAYSALAIAKAFGVSKANGLAVAAAIGASIGTAVASITGTISFATTKYAEIKEQSQKSTNYDEVAKNSSNLSNTEYNTSKVPPIDITINTNVDGRKLAETTAHYNHDAMKKQNLI